MRQIKQAIFYAPVSDAALVSLLGFYREDIAALEALGWNVVIVTRFREVLRHSVKSNLLYAWWWHKAVPAAVVCRLAGCAVVITGATNVSWPHVRWRWPRLALMKVAIRLAHVNIAISQFEASDLVRLGARNVKVVYPGVNTDPRGGRVKSPLPSAVIVAQLNSSSIFRKGVDRAVASAEVVRRVIPSFKLHVVGPISPDGAAWIENLSRKGLAGGVVFHGEVPAAERDVIVRSSWIYLQPSRYEGFGLAAAEALALGVPVVGSSAGAVPEVVGTGGLILREVEPAELGDVVADVLLDPDRLAELEALARTESLRFATAKRLERFASALKMVGISGQ